ncbi:MAG: hypothetical protein WDN06_09465 [Asticcacaulis sp.]
MQARTGNGGGRAAGAQNSITVVQESIDVVMVAIAAKILAHEQGPIGLGCLRLAIVRIAGAYAFRQTRQAGIGMAVSRQQLRLGHDLGAHQLCP